MAVICQRSDDFYLLLLLLLLYSFIHSTTASDADEDNIDKVKNIIRQGLKCHANPALAVSVVRDGEIIFAEGFGTKTVDSRNHVTNTTLFGIASLTKAFASTLLLKILDRHNNVSLSTPVSSILGEENGFYGNLRRRYATLEDLLAHRMGIPANNNIRLDETLTRENLIRRMKYLKATGGFRTSFFYSNLMYGLLTYIAEKLAGHTWEHLIQSELFDPIGMTSSTFATIADPNKIDLAQGYVDVDGELKEVPFEFSRRWAELCGSGCIISNAVDMAKWMMFQLNAGTNEVGKEIVGWDSLADSHKAQNSVGSSTNTKYFTQPRVPVTFSGDNYGLGWKLGYYRGVPLISHTGSTYGYRAMLTMYPSTKLGIFTAMTGGDVNYFFRTSIHTYVADLYLGHDPWLNHSTICTFPQPWFNKSHSSTQKFDRYLLPSREVSAYTGEFHNPAYGTFNVYTNITSGQLMGKIGYASFNLYAKEENDTFYAEGVGIIKHLKNLKTLRFISDSEMAGEITKLQIPSFESKLPPIFEKRMCNPASHTIAGNGSVSQVQVNTLLLMAVVPFLFYHTVCDS